MNILEKEIEQVVYDILYDDPYTDVLSERGLPLQGDPVRQCQMPGYGVADLVVIDYRVHPQSKYYKRCLYVSIVEFKKETINARHAAQLCRYMTAARRFLAQRFGGDRRYHTEVNGYLIGRDVKSDDDDCFLFNFLPDVGVYTWNLDLQRGIHFQLQTDFYRTKEDFTLANKWVDNQARGVHTFQYGLAMARLADKAEAEQ